MKKYVCCWNEQKKLTPSEAVEIVINRGINGAQDQFLAESREKKKQMNY